MMNMGRGVNVARSLNGAVLNVESRCLLGFAPVVTLSVLLFLLTFATTT